MAKSLLLPVAAILLVGTWHLATIRSGQDWGDDFALNLLHARNLSAGTAYADTGYIYHPQNSRYSPRAYPPIYPLLLAPVYRLYGLNFEVLKVQQVVFLVLLLTVVYMILGRDMPPAYAVGVTVLLGLSPFLWLYKDRVLAEIPFMFFTFLALYLLDGKRDGPVRRRLGRGLLAGVVVYLTCGTRVVGIVLLPSAILADMLGEGPPWAVRRWRLPGLASLAMVLMFAACMLAQMAVLVRDGSYLDQWAYDPATPFRNLVALARESEKVLAGGTALPLLLAVLAPVVGLLLLGYVTRLRQRATACECYVPLYLAVVLLWPVGGATPRYLLPLLPFVFMYLGHGVLRVAERVGPAWGRPAALGIAASVLAVYVALYARLEFGPLRSGVCQPEARELFDHIRDKTPADAVVVFSKPRALALFTGRRSSIAKTPASDQELWGHLRRINATHFVVGQPFPEEGLLRSFAERHIDRFQEVFRNRAFTVYRIVEPWV